MMIIYILKGTDVLGKQLIYLEKNVKKYKIKHKNVKCEMQIMK